jgi:DNA-binding CsgD family transcriptional regulator
VNEADFSEQNLRLMMELPRRLAACQADPLRAKRQLLRGLCRLVNAVTGVGAMFSDDFTVVGDVTIVQVDPADDSAESLSLSGEIINPSLPVLFTPAPLTATLEGLEKPCLSDILSPAQTIAGDEPETGARLFGLDNPLIKPFIAEAAKRSLEPTALARVEAVVDRQWYRSAFFRRFLAPMGLDDCILSIVPLPGMQPFIAVVCLSGPLIRPIDQRQRGGEPFFTPRQRRIVEIAHSQLRWVYYTPSAAIEEQHSAPVQPVCPSGPGLEKLAPRYQRVLNHLLGGGSEKELANHLGLSRFTVHEYVRAIYKKLNVNSRSELMARWVQAATPSNLLAS